MQKSFQGLPEVGWCCSHEFHSKGWHQHQVLSQVAPGHDNDNGYDYDDGNDDNGDDDDDNDDDDDGVLTQLQPFLQLVNSPQI